MPMPKKTCAACGAKASIGLKICKCGIKFKSKSVTNWAGVKVPPKVSLWFQKWLCLSHRP